jgi:hypothetical protein
VSGIKFESVTNVGLVGVACSKEQGVTTDIGQVGTKAHYRHLCASTLAPITIQIWDEPITEPSTNRFDVLDKVDKRR